MALAAYVAADINEVVWTAASYAITSFVLPLALPFRLFALVAGGCLLFQSWLSALIGIGLMAIVLVIVVSDSTATQHLERPNRPGVRLTNFWIERGSPAAYDGPTKTYTGDFVLHPPPLGSTFRYIEFLPEDPEVMKPLDGKTAFGEMGAAANIIEDGRHPFMHRTDSDDYAIVLTGEIWMVMDEEDDLLLRAGDVLTQRGNNHAWSNRGTEPCVIAFVLVDGVTQRDARSGGPKGQTKTG